MSPDVRGHAVGGAEKLYAGKSILITGGLGFIGSNLALRLANVGADVTIVDCELEGSGANEFNISRISQNIKVFKHDISDRTKMLPIIEKVDFVFNLSGYNNHLDSMVHPEKDLYSNCVSQLAFLSACAETGVRANMIFSGTRTQYGTVTENPVSESAPQRPLDIHGAHKSLAEYYHLLFNRSCGLNTIVVRITNVYGPRQAIRPRDIGLLASFILSALDDDAIEIFGTGDRTREILYVDDLIDALLELNATENAIGQCFNIGGFSASLKEIAETLISITGKGRITYKPFPKAVERIEVGEVRLDNTKIEKACGWRATTKPDKGLRKTIEFFIENKDKYVPV